MGPNPHRRLRSVVAWLLLEHVAGSNPLRCTLHRRRGQPFAVIFVFTGIGLLSAEGGAHLLRLMIVINLIMLIISLFAAAVPWAGLQCILDRLTAQPHSLLRKVRCMSLMSSVGCLCFEANICAISGTRNALISSTCCGYLLRSLKKMSSRSNSSALS